MERLDNNIVVVSGTIIENPVYNHEMFGERFFLFKLKSDRHSEAYDVLPVIVSERIMDVSKDYVGERIKVEGQFRSFNSFEDGRNRLVLTVFSKEVDFSVEETEENDICLNGYVCRPVTYRKTPLGREIADILLAVNRPYGKSDYIPCICWGRTARFAANFEVGKQIKVFGRIQSRVYHKKIDGSTVEARTAYEVSIYRIEEVTNEGESN